MFWTASQIIQTIKQLELVYSNVQFQSQQNFTNERISLFIVWMQKLF